MACDQMNYEVGRAMGQHGQADDEQPRIPNVGPPFTTQQVDDTVLEEQLRVDEASREEPPPVEHVIDSEQPQPPDSDGLAHDERP